MIKKFEDFVKTLSEKKDIIPAADAAPFTPTVSDQVPAMGTEQPHSVTTNPDEKKKKHEDKDVSGLKEVIEIKGLGKMKAKLDSGNTAMNALIVQDYYEKDGKVKFKYDNEDKEYDVVKHIRIWHHGKSTERPVIKVDIVFNGKTYEDELIDLKISDLTGTKNYRCRMLLSKQFMAKAKVVIDPSKEFELTDKKDLKKKKKKDSKEDNKKEKSEK